MAEDVVNRGDSAVSKMSELSQLSYADFFLKVAGFAPHPWQSALGGAAECRDRQLRIPTGFGKTLGVLAAWLYHRVLRNDDTWPRRLVWCLPMRVLVEQTEAEVVRLLTGLEALWDGRASHLGKVGVHLLMGGSNSGDWHLFPEEAAVLIGTQDMLLSRALNRGYGAARARWPMDFGLVNQDALWILDEVQLMDVGLATSAQLQAFRRSYASRNQAGRPSYSWWMSATLQRSWLEKSPEVREIAASIPQTTIPADARKGPLWEDVSKPLRTENIKDPKHLAQRVAEAHRGAAESRTGPTLVVVNRVDTAIEIYRSLVADKALKGTEFRLVHSRFRPAERAAWRSEFLNRKACSAEVNRIIVATQVVEAGVDISAGVLITELAPWSSLVQRLGRAARWGGSAQILVADFSPKDDKAAAPYGKAELDAAREALRLLADGSPLGLEVFEESHPELMETLYPYQPKHLLLSHELEDLFDTTPDLTGADTDISRFIRSGEERDLQVFWAEIPKGDSPDVRLRPTREALCAVPFLGARDWLCGKESKTSRAPRLTKGMRAWIWDWLDGDWRVAERRDLYPGQTVLVAADCGGYEPELGWSPKSSARVSPVTAVASTADELADSAEDDEHLSATPAEEWQTIAAHGRQVGDEAQNIAGRTLPELARLLELAGRWHDLGKAHPAFQNSIVGPDRPRRHDLAKAPDRAWLPLPRLYPDGQGRRRAGFRHELASTLGLFSVLMRCAPEHPALLGPWRQLLEAMGSNGTDAGQPEEPNGLEREIIALTASEFDLVAYLVCSHHGKVRFAWHASPSDQQAEDGVPRIRGICEGDRMPSTALPSADGSTVPLPDFTLTLAPAGIGVNPVTGRAWTDRVLGLLKLYSPLQLAHMESLLRAADIRASRAPRPDPLVCGESQSRNGGESR